jgi:hypothetical protein
MREWRPDAPTVIVMGGYAAIAGSLAPNSSPMLLATGIACVPIFGIALTRGWRHDGGRPRSPRRPTQEREQEQVAGRGRGFVVAVTIWLVLLAALATFQLGMYVSAPRPTYPTLSSLAEGVFDVWAVRVGSFAAWLWFGWYLVRR